MEGPVTFPKFHFDRARKSQARMKQPRGIPTLSTDLSLPLHLRPEPRRPHSLCGWALGQLVPASLSLAVVPSPVFSCRGS